VLAENLSATQPTKLLVVFIADDATALKTDDPHRAAPWQDGADGQ
jgi:hypothetical protein